MSNYDEAGNANKETMDNAMRSFSAMTKGFQEIAAETTEFTKRSYEQSARMFEQLAQTRSLDKVLEVQNDYAKTAYQSWVSQATKIGGIYTDIAKEVYKPFEASIAHVTSVGQSMMKQAA